MPADLYDVLMQHEIDLIDEGLIVFRDSAWRVATLLACEPSIMDQATIMVKDLEVAKQLILYPPDLIARIAGPCPLRRYGESGSPRWGGSGG